MKVKHLLSIGLTTTMLAHAQVTKSAFGTMPDGTQVDRYTLSSPSAVVKIITYGARLQSVEVPDKQGQRADVVLGHPDINGYLKDRSTYFGAVVGRYGNRIANGKFSLDGASYQLPKNDHGQSLHGGTDGFDNRVWKAHELPDGLELTLVSSDGDQGYPGQLTAHVRYTLHADTLRISYSAETTKPTVLNLTNHAYFNLAGEGNGNVESQRIHINADRYTPVTSLLIPTGQLTPVEGTPFDFRKEHAIGDHIKDTNEQLKFAGGYDHNWVLNGSTGVMKVAAELSDPASGRTLTISTTEPGVQFYTGNFLKEGEITGTGGKPYAYRGGLCLETQHFPDSPNQPSFPSTRLNPGQHFHSETVLKFGVRK